MSRLPPTSDKKPACDLAGQFDGVTPRLTKSAATNTQGMPQVILRRGSDVEPEAIRWLWDGWLASGKLHLIGGAPGTGKSTIALAMAAIVTSGGLWPDGSRAEQGNILFWSGEDDNADTLNPRLRAGGAEMSRVITVDGMRGGNERYPFDPARDMEALLTALRSSTDKSDLRLIIIDPIVSTVTGDSNKNAEVRRALQPLVDLAKELRCAVLGVTHFSKGTSGSDPVERINGSLAFGALPRLVMVAAKQNAQGDRPERRVLLRAKSNIGQDGGGFVYNLQQEALLGYSNITASSVAWGQAIQGSARELLAEAEQRNDGGNSDVVDFLRELLVNGPRSATEIEREAQSAGYSMDAMRRAKRKIRARVVKRGMQGGWDWYLPNVEDGAEGREDGGQRKPPSSPSSEESWLPSDIERESFNL